MIWNSQLFWGLMSSSALVATGETAEGWDQPGTKLPSATASTQNSLICPAFPPHGDVRATGVTGNWAWRVSPRGPPTGSCNVLLSLHTPRGQSLLRGCGLTKNCLIIIFTHASPRTLCFSPAYCPRGQTNPSAPWPGPDLLLWTLSQLKGIGLTSETQHPIPFAVKACRPRILLPNATGLDPGFINPFVMHGRPCHLETPGGLDASRLLIYQPPYDGLSTKRVEATIVPSQGFYVNLSPLLTQARPTWLQPTHVVLRNTKDHFSIS